MSKPSFVYVTYIVATPEKLFSALIDPELTRRYWSNHRNNSDWRVGSAWRMEDYDDATEIDVQGTVIEHDPPRRLVITWSTPNEVGDFLQTSRVTFDLEPLDKSVRLTVTHDDLEPDSEQLRSISFGWPAVLSGLKTLLETGDIRANLWDEKVAV